MRFSPSCRATAAALTVIMACAAASTARAEGNSDAKSLVLLRKQHERQAQAVRFMVAVSPFGEMAGVAECTARKAEAPLMRYLESLYASRLSAEELRQAVAFYGGREGREAVRLKLEYEEGLFSAALKREQVTESGPTYPADVRRALDLFAKTSAGANFAGEELEDREPYRTEVSELRSAALTECLLEKAKQQKEP